MENSIARLIFNSASIDVRDAKTYNSHNRDSALALASLSLSQLENPIVSELLPLALQFDLAAQFSTARGAFSFIKYYRQDVRRRRFASLNVLLRAYFGVQGAKILAQTFDRDVEMMLLRENKRNGEFYLDDERNSSFNGGAYPPRIYAGRMRNSASTAGNNAFDNEATAATAKMYYFRMFRLNAHINRQRAQFLASFAADDDVVRQRFCFQLLFWLASVKRRFARVESHFAGPHMFLRLLRENALNCREKSHQLTLRLAASLYLRETAALQAGLPTSPVRQQADALCASQHARVPVQDVQKWMLLLPKLLASRKPRRLSAAGSPDVAIERYFYKTLACKTLNAMQDVAYRQLSVDVFATRYLSQAFLRLRLRLAWLKNAEASARCLTRTGTARRALGLLRQVAGYKMAEKTSAISCAVSVVYKRAAFEAWVEALAERQLAARRAALWRAGRDVALQRREFTVWRACSARERCYAAFEGRVILRVLRSSFEHWSRHARQRAVLRGALNAACARYLRAQLREKLESSAGFIFQTKYQVFKGWKDVMLQTKLSRALQYMEELAEAARSRFLQFQAMSCLHNKILTVREKGRLMQQFVAHSHARAVLSNWRRRLFSDAAAASSFRADRYGRALKARIFTALRETLHVSKLSRLLALKIERQAFCWLTARHERTRLITAYLAGRHAYGLETASFKALCDAALNLRHKESSLRRQHAGRTLQAGFAKWHRKAADLAHRLAILQDYRVLYVFRAWEGKLTARRLRALAALRGRRAALQYYFKAWVAFMLCAKRQHLIQVKKALFYQDLLGRYAAAVLAGAHSKSLVRYENAARIAASVAKAGLRAPLQVKQALAVEEFRLMLRAFVAWRWRLRVASYFIGRKV